MIGHVAPEAALGGPIAAVHEGDTIHFDVNQRILEVEVSDAALRQRLAHGNSPAALPERRVREVRGAGVVGIGRRDHPAKVGPRLACHPERSQSRGTCFPPGADPAFLSRLLGPVSNSRSFDFAKGLASESLRFAQDDKGESTSSSI